MQNRVHACKREVRVLLVRFARKKKNRLDTGQSLPIRFTESEQRPELGWLNVARDVEQILNEFCCLALQSRISERIFIDGAIKSFDRIHKLTYYFCIGGNTVTILYVEAGYKKFSNTV